MEALQNAINPEDYQLAEWERAGCNTVHAIVALHSVYSLAKRLPGGIARIKNVGGLSSKVEQVSLIEKMVVAGEETELSNWNPCKKKLTWGRSSNGHLIKHRDVLGYGHKSAQEAQKIIPKLKESVKALLKQSNPKLTRIGNFITVIK